MSPNASCLNCRNYRPDAPEGWKPGYPSQAFDIDVLRRHLGSEVQWNSGWPGQCRLQPTPVAVKSVHQCGQWVVHDKFLLTWGDLHTYFEMSSENTRVEAELKRVKALAAERFHRLKKMKSKSSQPKAKAKTPADAEVVAQ